MCVKLFSCNLRPQIRFDLTESIVARRSDSTELLVDCSLVSSPLLSLSIFRITWIKSWFDLNRFPFIEKIRSVSFSQPALWLTICSKFLLWSHVVTAEQWIGFALPLRCYQTTTYHTSDFSLNLYLFSIYDSLDIGPPWLSSHLNNSKNLDIVFYFIWKFSSNSCLFRLAFHVIRLNRRDRNKSITACQSFHSLLNRYCWNMWMVAFNFWWKSILWKVRSASLSQPICVSQYSQCSYLWSFGVTAE